MTITFFAALLVSYLVGAIPFGLLFSRRAGMDVRREGSGNIGATNVTRVLGKKLGILTLLCDVAKGFIPVFLASIILPHGDNRELFVGLCGLATVLGHMFPIYLSFRGGKGVATALGVFLYFSPWAIFTVLFVFVAVVAVTGFVSAGSLAAAGLIPLCIWLLDGNTSVLLPAFVIVVLIWIKHSSNIARICRGEEKSWKTKSSQ
ncbi:MAG: glycerol-3-phosphate 1-O-acyltransferase PlsY [Proteobacteria bacterium]|nr:glycerol-3-phosphate 1-O-acyltransferase PlsY [Pseudomonadota bacterium]MBU1455431.1 glycerol-3-phosphate 1-O-acyltransferase PlsY [Pseudomonadota bacterium]